MLNRDVVSDYQQDAVQLSDIVTIKHPSMVSSNRWFRGVSRSLPNRKRLFGSCNGLLYSVENTSYSGIP